MNRGEKTNRFTIQQDKSDDFSMDQNRCTDIGAQPVRDLHPVPARIRVRVMHDDGLAGFSDLPQVGGFSYPELDS